MYSKSGTNFELTGQSKLTNTVRYDFTKNIERYGVLEHPLPTDIEGSTMHVGDHPEYGLTILAQSAFKADAMRVSEIVFLI